MRGFYIWAQPWWVNLLFFVPVVCYSRWRRKGLLLSFPRLLLLALFGASFGFVEAVVVVYLRAASSLSGYAGLPSQIQSSSAIYRQTITLLTQYPQRLLAIEAFREIATMIMLVTVAMLAAPKIRERWASFLWIFAIWDLAYYAGLWTTLRWPSSLKDFDVLFLLPVPWMSQVWFPVLVSAMTLLAIALTRKQGASAESVKSQS
jgi:hypothetical protein